MIAFAAACYKLWHVSANLLWPRPTFSLSYWPMIPRLSPNINLVEPFYSCSPSHCITYRPLSHLTPHNVKMTLPSAIPRARRAAQAFFFAPLFCLTISGVVFGFAGKPFPPRIGRCGRGEQLITVLCSFEADPYKRGDLSELLYGEGS